MTTANKITAVKIVFENCEVLRFPVDVFETLLISNLQTDYRMFPGHGEIVKICWANGGVAFKLKKEADDRKYFVLSTELEPGREECPAPFQRLQARMNITRLYLVYADGSDLWINVPYRFQWKGGEESLLQSVEIDPEDGGLWVWIEADEEEDKANECDDKKKGRNDR